MHEMTSKKLSSVRLKLIFTVSHKADVLKGNYRLINSKAHKVCDDYSLYFKRDAHKSSKSQAYSSAIVKTFILKSNTSFT